jgi:hypothetical protein
MFLESRLLWVSVSWRMYTLRTTLSIFALMLGPLGRIAIISLYVCFMTLLIDDYVIIVLAEEVMGPWGFPWCPLDRQLNI